MVKKKSSKKKKVSKKIKKTSPKSKFSSKNFNVDRKKNVALYNLVSSLVVFVVFLVLYFLVSNYFLEVLFGIGALIMGAISVAFAIVLISLTLYKVSKKNSKKR